MKRTSLMALVMSFLWAHGFSQDSLSTGDKYLNFEINRTPFISGGYFIQNRLALQAGIGFSFNGENDSNGLGIQLEVDKYLRGGRLSPLLGGYVRFDINPNALDEAGWEGSRMFLGGHWGLNLFLWKNFAAAGMSGVELIFNSPERGNDSTVLTSLASSVKFRFFF